MRNLFIFTLLIAFSVSSFSQNPTGASGLQMPPKATQECVNAVKEYRMAKARPHPHLSSEEAINEYVDKKGKEIHRLMGNVMDVCNVHTTAGFKSVLTIPTSTEEQQCLYHIKFARQYYNMAHSFYKANNTEEQNKFLNFAIRDFKKADILCNKKGASEDAMKTIGFYLEEIPKHLNEIKNNSAH